MNSPHSRLAFLWRPTFLAWAFFSGECLALAMSLAPGVEGDRAIWFGLNSLLVQWIIAISLLITRALSRSIERMGEKGIARSCLVILVLSTALTLGLFWAVTPPSLRPVHDSPGFLLASACILALLYGLMAVGMLENHLRLRRMAVHSTQSQLQALQARIRPHFLFNTLNSAVALAHTDPERTEALLMDLSDLFRMALSDAATIKLGEELELCRRYIAIEQARFGERLQLDWQIDHAPLQALVPPLCLQPLLENAVHHGVERLAGTTPISLTVTTGATGLLQIDISNPVPDPPMQSPPRRGHGVGLEAVRARLAAFDPHARLDAELRDGRFIARLRLPVRDQVTTR